MLENVAEEPKTQKTGAEAGRSNGWLGWVEFSSLKTLHFLETSGSWHLSFSDFLDYTIQNMDTLAAEVLVLGCWYLIFVELSYFFNFSSQANLLLSGRRRSSPAQEPIALVTKEQSEQPDDQHQAGLLAPKEPTNQGDHHQAGLVVNKETTNQQLPCIAHQQVSTGLTSKVPPLTIDTSPTQALNPLQPPNNVRHLESSTNQLSDKASSRNLELSTTQSQELESASCALEDKVGPKHKMSLSWKPLSQMSQWHHR